MKQQLISVLETFGYPVFLQGSLNENEAYPDSFFTFWNNSADDLNHYDNEPIAFEWDFDVNFYSTDPVKVNTVLLQTRAALMAAGFTVRGKGHDVMSDEITHTGRGLDVFFRENNTRDEDEGAAVQTAVPSGGDTSSDENEEESGDDDETADNNVI